ncbi:hypothetical protein QKU48_gp0563 [Fadolivirus algeromassiliense]|jgi:hypothetical protein|uniref:Endonuclease n=1 Tax=Fadolivirus FV1/VV64 TaxID=3070911 RepID=A0A7D3R0W7_9VIRU|nr:hypothetical protein QKU48_gp0563 [Fadolivirus algeromassiliense]QKF94021.1 hypothetical protein Fadolivirus_1_563 [Fadolivirus FV1/VV64]
MGKDKKCKNTSCDKTAAYGYKGSSREYCSEHKLDDMINLKGYICAIEGCTKRASYGYTKKDKKLYCVRDKKDDMINVLNKMCLGCNKVQPTYNKKGEKKPLYCVDCATLGMVNVKDNKCIICKIVIASYGYPRGKKEYCAADKLDGMEDLTRNKCPICNRIAQFNYSGESKGIYCSEHKLDGMVDLFNKKCKTCGKSAAYGWENGEREYCTKCKLSGMINVYGKKCLGKNGIKCNKDPCYGLVGGKATHCADCANNTMVNVKSRKCIKCNDKVSTFNFLGNPPKYCKNDAEIGMIDVTAKRCDECTTTAGFGYPGNQPIKCARHKIKGMIYEPSKKCISKGCKEPAIYGIKFQSHCEKHKEPDEYNLIEKECKLCNLPMILNESGLCGFCDPTMIKTFKLYKQKEIKDLLDHKKFEYILYDRIIDSQCSNYRPDFVFDCGTHFVVLEVDENQHNSYNNNPQNNNNNPSTYSCEEIRMINISQALGMKTIFIRYNPDDYKVNGIKQEITKNRRHIILLKNLNNMILMKSNELSFLNVLYLFYDDYDIKKNELKPIIFL